MDVIEQLKRVGLTQYEAEAYVTLLREGPLTGYEVGKRSKVPLPRSYDVVERLVNRGLALVQPSESSPGGDAPRYRAEAPARFLAGLRADLDSSLGALQTGLAGITTADTDEGFWVIRGRERILARTVAMIQAAELTLALALPSSLGRELSNALAEARGRDLRRLEIRPAGNSGDLIVLVDRSETLIGTIAREPCQAVVTRNRSLVSLVERSFVTGAQPSHSIRAGEVTGEASDWLAWEGDKHRRLRLLMGGGSDVA